MKIEKIYEAKNWNLLGSPSKSAILEGDYVGRYVIGENPNDHISYVYIAYLSIDNYKRILEGKYTYDIDLTSSDKVILYDENGNRIPLVKTPDSNVR